MNLSGRLVWVLRGLCLAGMGISAYLAWTALNMKEVYGCGGSELFDCSHVLTSKWSKVMGIPVSLPACGLYASLLVMLGFARRKAPADLTRWLWSSITACGAMAGLAAAWFIGLQVFVLQHLCPYCLAVHSCGLILCGLLMFNPIMSVVQKGLAGSFASAAIAGLITIQVMTPEADHFQVVRYDDVTVGSDAGQELVSAPDEVFSAPGEIDEAPVGVFEAPGTDAPPESSSPSEAVKADPAQPVASTLLMLMPSRFLLTNQLLTFGLDESQKSDEPASDAKSESAASGTAASPEVTKDNRRLVTVAGNRVTLDARQWPLIGKPDARYIFVEMYDYTCPHCRNTQAAIKGALEQYGDDLAIVVLPVPLDASCNDAASGGGHAGACELARIAVAVWRVDPVRFREFHDWVFESHATPATARAKAEQLVGAEKFRKEFASKTPSEYVKRHVDLYKKVGRGSVPKLMFPKSTINGEMNSKTTLCSTIERELAANQPVQR